MTTLTILHVEDDPEAAAAVAAILSAQGIQVTHAGTGKDGLMYAGRIRFDVAILDRMLPDMTGVDVLRKLRAGGATMPVLMLSALGQSDKRVEGLEAGADDYLAKPFEPGELLARVNALHRRASVGSHGAVIMCNGMECHVKARTAWRNGRHVPLSPREFDLFRYFMENAGQVVTREMLLRDVWNLTFDPQTNVIDVNVGRLRRKLEDGFDAPALETVWGSGYRLLDA